MLALIALLGCILSIPIPVSPYSYCLDTQGEHLRELKTSMYERSLLQGSFVSEFEVSRKKQEDDQRLTLIGSSDSRISRFMNKPMPDPLTALFYALMILGASFSKYINKQHPNAKNS